MTDATSVAADQLRAIVERIERIEAEITDLNEGKSDIYKEAKGAGFDVPILRKIVAERRKPASKFAEEQAILELYREALNAAQPRARTRALA